MTFSFRPAVRGDEHLLISLAGESGSGKTMTAMRLAKGICGDRPFAVIDTENGRAKHYADYFRFDHGDLRAPFTPMAYEEAIESAAKEGYPVIIVDSVSHEHAGDGGLLDWHEENLQRMAGDDPAKREKCAMAAWVKPKMAHKKMVQKYLAVNAHLILCLRAEPKVRMIKREGKTVIEDAGFLPVCEKNLPYEMTVSFLFSSEFPGYPLKPLKLQKQHQDIFLRKDADGNLVQIGEGCGKMIAEWAKGARKPEGKVSL